MTFPPDVFRIALGPLLVTIVRTTSVPQYVGTEGSFCLKNVMTGIKILLLKVPLLDVLKTVVRKEMGLTVQEGMRVRLLYARLVSRY